MMKKWYKKFIFNYQIYKMKTLLEDENNVFSYPLIIDLTFNEHRYWEKYFDNGKSVRSQVESKLNIIRARTLRHLKREPSSEVYERLETFRAYRRNSKFIDEVYKNNPELKSH